VTPRGRSGPSLIESGRPKDRARYQNNAREPDSGRAAPDCNSLETELEFRRASFLAAPAHVTGAGETLDDRLSGRA
jgi:hypothetical protein